MADGKRKRSRTDSARDPAGSAKLGSGELAIGGEDVDLKHIDYRIDVVVESIMLCLDIEEVKEKFLTLVVNGLGPMLGISGGRLWELRNGRYVCVQEVGKATGSIGKEIPVSYPPIKIIIDEGFVSYSMEADIASKDLELELVGGPFTAGVAIGHNAELIGGFTLDYEAEWQEELLRRMLRRIARGTAMALYNAERYQRVLRSLESVEREMYVARRMQEVLLPEPPTFPGFDIHARIVSSEKVGGDYYNFFKLQDSGLAAVIADVAGKGLPAAMLMNQLHGALGVKIHDETKISALVRTLNDFLCDATTPEKFITMFYCELYPNGLLAYCNAGHDRPLLLRGGVFCELIEGGMALGFFKNQKYEHAVAKLLPGDVVVMYTDGLTEAFGSGAEEFGIESLQDIILLNSSQSAREICRKIFEAVDVHQGPQSRQPGEVDDKTVVVIKALDLGGGTPPERGGAEAK
jgi:serine phosphatase RsbU (regulator of sigma subunit)